MKYFFSALLIGFTLLPFMAKADIAPDPGMHEYSFHAEFDNLADYPDYDVYVSESWRFGPSLVLAGDAVAPIASDIELNGHPSTFLPPFVAVKQSNQAKIVHKDDPYGEQGDMWDSLPENQQYFINATVTGRGASLENETVLGGFLPDSNPAVYFVWVYHIDSLSDTEFTAHFVSESRYDAQATLVDGPALSSTIETNTTPVSSANTSTPYWIVIVGVGVIILILAGKAWKK